MGVAVASSILLGFIIAPVLIVRLVRRLGKPPTSAGPNKMHFPPPPGQEQIPQELFGIVSQLPRSSNGQVSSQLVYTVNRLLDVAHLTHHGHLPSNATVDQLQEAVTLLENHLDLEPLHAVVHLPESRRQGHPPQ